MNLLISLLILLIVASLVWWLISMLPLPAPAMQIARVIFVLICLIYLVGMLFGAAPTLNLRL